MSLWHLPRGTSRPDGFPESHRCTRSARSQIFVDLPLELGEDLRLLRLEPCELHFAVWPWTRFARRLRALLVSGESGGVAAAVVQQGVATLSGNIGTSGATDHSPTR